MANVRNLLVLGLLVLINYVHGEKCSDQLICTDDKECCSTGCCNKFWTTWRIIVIAGAGVVGLGMIIVLVVVAVYQICFKKNSKSGNNVVPMQQQQPRGSNDQPPPYEYYINERDTAFSFPPPLPQYSKQLGPGEKKVKVKAVNKDD